MTKLILLRYDGPGHILDAFGVKVPRGNTAQFTEAEATSLLDQPHIRVTPVADTAAPAR